MSYVTKLDDQLFESVLSTNKLVLVDYWAEWCGPCRMISPVVDELSNDYFGKVSVCKLNVDENQTAVEKAGIRNIPALILYKDGEIVDKVVGVVSKQKLVEMIEEHL